MRAKKTASAKKAPAKKSAQRASSDTKRPALSARSDGSRTEASSGDGSLSKAKQARRREFLYRMLTAKRREVLKEIGEVIGQSLTNDQQRRLEAAMDVGDQALMDLEREMGISLLEMRNRKRQLIDEALTRLDEGTYGVCAECGVEISEKRLAAVPFAKLCVDCQSRQELLEKIEKEEERE